MRFIPTELAEVVVVEPAVHRDARGFFLESFHAAKFAEGGIRASFVQDNHSLSARGTLRGLHAQLRHPQGKLVRCTEGRVYDVAVDVRRGSHRAYSYRELSELLEAAGFSVTAAAPWTRGAHNVTFIGSRR